MWAPAVYLKEKTGQIQYYLFGAVMTISGIVVSLTPMVDSNLGPFLYFSGWGISFFVLGLVRYILFVRRYPLIDMPEDRSDEP
jgi:hypothetical protein